MNKYIKSHIKLGIITLICYIGLCLITKNINLIGLIWLIGIYILMIIHVLIVKKN